MKQAAKSLFWGSLAVIFYTYVGFPLLTLLRGLLWSKPFRRHSDTPAVSFIIAAHNEAAVIQQKLDNTLALDYPHDCLEIIVASDGSDDDTNNIAAGYGPPVRLLALPRQGKNHAVNQAALAATHHILVFTDADSMLEAAALRHLVAPFGDPAIGGVGGDYRYATAGAQGEGERTYWSFDRLLKEMQSRSGSMTSATGQIYAVRRELFQPVPAGVTDDAQVTRGIIGAGYRLVFEPKAVARGPIADASGEFRRKVRVTTRGLNGVWQQRSLLNPLVYGWYGVQLFSHKVLRRLMAFPLLILTLTAPLLWSGHWLYKLAAVGQMALHGLALLGYWLRGTAVGRAKLFVLPFHFDMVNIAAIMGLTNLLRGQSFDVWAAERGDQPDEEPA